MAKGGKKRSRAGGGSWTGAEHAVHDEEIRRKLLKKTEAGAAIPQKELRRQAGIHGTAEKRQDLRLKLHLTKTKRELELLKERLENWDPVEEKQKEEEARKKREAEKLGTPKKKGRKGPETWKLKGAARPAWEVYDFDVRYVDPFIEAHKNAAAKKQRSQNILAIYRGRLAREGPEVGREYLSILMQLGHLSQEAKQFKTARSTWLECIELEGEDPVTTARESLMRMYVDLNRYDSALKLGERLSKDSSVWVRYSTALVGIINKSNEAENYLVSAIRSNPFCAYYLAFYEVFVDVYEYTDAIEESEDGPQSSLEEAIEYCCSNGHASRWSGEPSVALRKLVIQGMQGRHDLLSATDLEWEERLAAIEQDYLSRESSEKNSCGEIPEEVIEAENGEIETEKEINSRYNEGSKEDDNETEKESTGSDSEEYKGEEDEEPNSINITMYAGMFRTAMDMVKEDGLL